MGGREEVWQVCVLFWFVLIQRNPDCLTGNELYLVPGCYILKELSSIILGGTLIWFALLRSSWMESVGLSQLYLAGFLVWHQNRCSGSWYRHTNLPCKFFSIYHLGLCLSCVPWTTMVPRPRWFQIAEQNGGSGSRKLGAASRIGWTNHQVSRCWWLLLLNLLFQIDQASALLVGVYIFFVENRLLAVRISE